MRSIATRIVVVSFLVIAVATPGLANDAAKLESQGGGLQTATFDTFSGTVTVNLPEDIVAGDTFSGTVVAEPDGDSDKKKEKNRSALAGYLFELSEHPRGKVGDGRLKLDVPETPGTATLILREVRKGKPGREVGRVEIPIRDTAPEIPDFRLPTLTQQNVPLRVSGPFDGDLESSALSIGGVEALPLAESPRGAIFRSPPGVVGVAPISLHERGEPVAEGEVRSIATTLSAPKANLAAGESTTLTTRVSGLEDLNEDIPLRLRFWPPAIISVQGGYDHVKTIRPEDVAPDGTYSFGVRVTGRAPGGWGASARLEVPEPSVIDHYVLVLEGKPVGEIEPVSGVGSGTTDFESLTVTADLDLAKPFYDWIQASFTEGPQKKDGRIVGVDATGRSVEASDFRQAYIESIRFPRLDGSDRSPATMTVMLQPESVHHEKGSGEIVGSAGPKTKQWLCANFRFEIGDLPLDRVSKVDSFTWTQKIVKDEVGSFREPTREPAAVETPDLEVTLSSAELSTWERWHRGFYIIDRSVPRSSTAADARLVWLGPDGNEELASLEFHDVTSSSLTIDDTTTSSTDARTVSIELSGGQLRLNR